MQRKYTLNIHVHLVRNKHHQSVPFKLHKTGHFIRTDKLAMTKNMASSEGLRENFAVTFSSDLTKPYCLSWRKLVCSYKNILLYAIYKEFT